jgi:hypothetical protein
MDEQGPPGAQGEDDMFPPALDAADLFPLDPFAQVPPGSPKALIQADFHSGKFQLKNPVSQSPDDGFYFRQFGHDSSSPILHPGKPPEKKKLFVRRFRRLRRDKRRMNKNCFISRKTKKSTPPP